MKSKKACQFLRENIMNQVETNRPDKATLKRTISTLRQLPGCLPDGYMLDSLLTVEQFAIWQQLSVITVRRMLANLPGVIKRSRENIRIHPRTYLEKSVKK